MRKLFATLVAAAGIAATTALPAHAAGVDGVNLTPQPAVSADGKVLTAFHVTLHSGGVATEHFMLRNLTSTPRTVRVYGAAATRSPSGAYAVAGPQTASWIGLRDQQVTLAPHASRVLSFKVSRSHAPKGHLVYGAVVVEKSAGTVTERAATLVYLTRAGTDVTKSVVLPALIAAAVLGLVVFAQARVRSHH